MRRPKQAELRTWNLCVLRASVVKDGGRGLETERVSVGDHSPGFGGGGTTPLQAQRSGAR